MTRRGIALPTPDAARAQGGGERPEPIPWIQQNFYLYDTGHLMGLYDCQQRPLARALARDERGLFIYNTVLWSWPKKSAKSCVVAAVADYTAEHGVNASIKLVANDLRQADSRVGFYIRESITRHPTRKGNIKITPSGYKMEYPSGAKIEMIPIDPSGEAGGNDDMIVYSELWGWKSKAHQRMWSEMTLSPNKFGNSQRWIDTYAGFSGESPILEQLYDVGVKQGVRIWDDLEVYENRAAKMLAVWVTKPMFPWQSNDYYAEQSNTLTPSEFRRMHLNEWVSSENAFVHPTWWDACMGDVPPLEPYETLILSADAAVVGDCFALVAVSRRGDILYPRYVNVWKPQDGVPIDFALPEAEIRRLCSMGNVKQFCFDPYQMIDLSQRLKKDGVTWVSEFAQGQERAFADKQLYDLILARRIVHDGNEILREHITNANAKSEGDGKTLRMVKRSESFKIDAAVALSQACARALTLNIG